MPAICQEHSVRFFAEVEAALQVPTRRTAEGGLPGRSLRRSGAASPALVARFEELLVQNAGLDVCDRCAARELECSIAALEDAAAAVTGCEDFLRDEWRCGRCATRGMVTRARRARQARNTSRSAA